MFFKLIDNISETAIVILSYSVFQFKLFPIMMLSDQLMKIHQKGIKAQYLSLKNSISSSVL